MLRDTAIVGVTKAAQESTRTKWLRAGERTLKAKHWFTKPGFKRHVDDVPGASPGQTRGKPDRSRHSEHWMSSNRPDDPAMHEVQGDSEDS